MRVLVDSDVFIDILRKHPPAQKVLSNLSSKAIVAYFSAITEAELLSGRECKDTVKKNAVFALLGLASKVSVTNEIAVKAGELRRETNVALPDALIAATASVLKVPVLTKNVDDFQRAGVHVLTPY